MFSLDFESKVTGCNFSLDKKERQTCIKERSTVSKKMPPTRSRTSGKAAPAAELLEQMEKMNDMLNAENKMMEDKIGEMNGENVEWMKKCSELQGEVENSELQHEQALTILIREKAEVEEKLKSKEKQFDTFKQQCLTAAKQSVDIVRKDKQSDVEALSKALEDSSEALKKADEELKRMKLKEMIKDDSKKKKEEAQEILEMFNTKESTVRVLLNSLAARQHSLKQFEAELKTKAASVERLHELEVAVEEKEKMIESLLHRMDIDREAEAKERQVVAELKEALEKAEMKIKDKDGDLADFEEEISKLLNANNEYEQELNLTRNKLAAKSSTGSKKEIEEAYKGFNEAMQIQKEALAKVEEEKKEVERKLDEVEKRGIARQASVTAKFSAETVELKQKLKMAEEEKEREVKRLSCKVVDMEKVLREKEKEQVKAANLETLLGKKEEEKAILRSKLAEVEEKMQNANKELDGSRWKVVNHTEALERVSSLKNKLAEKERELNGLVVKMDEKDADVFGLKLQFDNKLSEKESEMEAMKKKTESKMRTFTEKMTKKGEEDAQKLAALKTELCEKEKLVQNLTERVQKYKRKETIEKDVHLNELAEKEAKIKALEITTKETLLKEKELKSSTTEKLEKEMREKDSAVDELRLKYENMKEKARKYKNEAKLGSNRVNGQSESKMVEMEARIGKLVKELDEKEAILIDAENKRKKTEIEVGSNNNFFIIINLNFIYQVAGQHSLQLVSYQAECGNLKQQLNEKVKEVEELQEKVNTREVENDDEIYLLKKEIKTLTELSQQNKSVGAEENLDLLKKAKRREKEDLKQMKKLEEKVQKYKLIIKDTKKRKLEEDVKSNFTFKIPKKSAVEKSDELSLSELVSKAQEWTEKNLKKSESVIPKTAPKESESDLSLIDIPLPDPVHSLRKSPNVELEEASNQRFYQQRQSSQWSPPPRRDERSRSYSSRESLRLRPFNSSDQRGFHIQQVPAYDPMSPGLSYPPMNQSSFGRDPRRREVGLDEQDIYQQAGHQGSYLDKVYGILSRAGHNTNAWQSGRWGPSMPRYGPY